MGEDPLRALMAEVAERYGQDSLVIASESKTTARIRRVPTGILSLDNAMGGGIPVSRTFQFRGEWSSGKTLLMLRAAAAFQRHCRTCGKLMVEWDELRQTGTKKVCCRAPEPCRVAWFDSEGAWDRVWSAKFGVDSDRVYLSQSEFAEEAIDIGDTLIRSGEVDLFVVDSLAQLVPSKEIEESTEKWQMGLQARLLNKAMRKWVSAQNETRRMGRPMGCTIGLINQVRMKIGVMFGSPETSPGGKGIDFACSLIGRTKAKGMTEGADGRPLEHGMEVNFRRPSGKNKTAPPRTSGEFKIQIAPGGDRAIGGSDLGLQLVRIASYWGLIKQKGSYFELARGVKVQGEDAASAYLTDPDNKALVKLLIEAVQAKEVAWLNGET